jgi:transcriptional regulator GlxA family with amidase domain
MDKNPAESDKMSIVERGPVEIGLVVYPGVQLAAVHGLTDLFLIADRLAAAQGNSRPALRVTHWELDASGEAVACVYDTFPKYSARPEIILIPLTLADPPPPPRVTAPLARWIRHRHSDGAVVGSVCSGAFLLAQTGVLAGRPAATHWCYAEVLAARFPDECFDINSRLIDHGDVITAGGFMAWVELGFRLVTRLLGPAIGVETERFVAIDPDTREQRYLNGFSPKLTHGDAAILRAQHWLHGRDARRVSLTTLAAKAKLEKRTFLRRFARATGVTPLEYCRNVRIARARELLEFSSRTLKVIAWEVGYSDPGAFARVFQKAMGLSPRAYRRQYGVDREAATARTSAGRAGKSRAKVHPRPVFAWSAPQD